MRTPQAMIEGWLRHWRTMSIVLRTARVFHSDPPMCCQPGISVMTSKPISSQRSMKWCDWG